MSLSLGARESDDRVEEPPKGEKRVAGLNHPRRERATQTPDDTLAPPARQLLALVDPARHGVGEAATPQRPSIPLTSRTQIPPLLLEGNDAGETPAPQSVATPLWGRRPRRFKAPLWRSAVSAAPGRRWARYTSRPPHEPRPRDPDFRGRFDRWRRPSRPNRGGWRRRAPTRGRSCPRHSDPRLSTTNCESLGETMNNSVGIRRSMFA